MCASAAEATVGSSRYVWRAGKETSPEVFLTEDEDQMMLDHVIPRRRCVSSSGTGINVGQLKRPLRDDLPKICKCRIILQDSSGSGGPVPGSGCDRATDGF